MNHWVLLSIAIFAEVVATSFLKAGEGFTKIGPSLVVGVGYAISFYFLSLALRSIPVGIAYAVWSGSGIVLVLLVAWFAWGQRPDGPAILGICLIVAGVALIHLFSNSAGH